MSNRLLLLTHRSPKSIESPVAQWSSRATFTELSLTIRGVSYSLTCKMIALFGSLKTFFGVKREDLTHLPKGTHPPPKHVYGCTERKSTLLGVSCGRVEVTPKKITRGCNFRMEGAVSICPPHPHFRLPSYFACGVGLWT